MAVQEKIENTVFDTLFNAYLDDEIAELKPVWYDDTKELDERLEAFEKKFSMDYSTSEELYSLMREYSYLCEKRGFISGLILGVSLLKVAEVSV